ncbi:DUF4254 domain-containing protein [Nocardia gipuzkoensis]|uniref:DUF4254 domain-containing protein n=1 Tax=Nocardia gipuzkoensis TaxID=2749991 RepID=UPI0034DD4C39
MAAARSFTRYGCADQPGRPTRSIGHRLRWVEAIDRWVAFMTPVPSPNALLHTETVGHIVDRMAQHKLGSRWSLPTRVGDCEILSTRSTEQRGER